MAKKRFTPQPAKATPAQSMKVTPPEVHLTEEETKAIDELRVKLVQAKIALADATMQMQMVSETTGDALAAFRAKVEEIGKAHGIPVNDPSQGRWNFDVDAKVFTKIKA